MRAYSLDLRERVLADCDAGQTTKPVAAKYGVSRTWVRSLKQRRRETGEIAPRKGGGRKRKIDRARLTELVREDPDATLAELRQRLAIRCALSAIWTALHELKLTFKKSRCGRRSRTVPTSRNAAPPGACGKPGSTPSGSSSLTKPGPRPT
jgi:putative transposase